MEQPQEPIIAADTNKRSSSSSTNPTMNLTILGVFGLTLFCALIFFIRRSVRRGSEPMNRSEVVKRMRNLP